MEDVHYFALMGNVDKTILNLDLGDGFIVEEWSVEKFIDIYTDLTELPEVEAWIKLDTEWGYGKAGRTIYRLESVLVITKHLPEYPKPHFSKKFDENFQAKFLETNRIESMVMQLAMDKLTKLRLFDDGSITLCYEAFYNYENGSYEMYASKEESLFGKNKVYKVKKNSIPSINQILRSKPILTKHKYINFALENFSESYRVAHAYLAFVSLMMSMEALFNDGKYELRNKVSRGCAVLLGKTIKSSRKIFSDLKKLYDLRSTLVHTGDTTKIDVEDLLLLRSYVRQSLLRVIELDMTKQELSVQLSENGFGAYKKLKSP